MQCCAGHSLGGALATLAAYDAQVIGRRHNEDCKVGIPAAYPKS